MSARPIRLPTASRRMIRQTARGPERVAAAIEASAGKVVALPKGNYSPPWIRRQDARDAELRAIYEAGGLTTSPAFLIAVATFAALPEENRQLALAQLLCRGYGDDAAPAAKAALRFATDLDGALSVLARAPSHPDN